MKMEAFFPLNGQAISKLYGITTVQFLIFIDIIMRSSNPACYCQISFRDYRCLVAHTISLNQTVKIIK
jgi:hypothetical protein